MIPNDSHVFFPGGEDAFSRYFDLVPSAYDAPRSAASCMPIGFLCLILEVGATDLHLGDAPVVLVTFFFEKAPIFDAEVTSNLKWLDFDPFISLFGVAVNI